MPNPLLTVMSWIAARPWFPETHVHNPLLTEMAAALLTVGLFAVFGAVIANSDASYDYSLTRTAEKLRDLFAVVSAVTMAGAVVLWLGPLNESRVANIHPLVDPFGVHYWSQESAYWAQETYKLNFLLLVIRHIVAFAALFGLWLLADRIKADFRWECRRLGFWVANSAAATFGLGLLAVTAFFTPPV